MNDASGLTVKTPDNVLELSPLVDEYLKAYESSVRENLVHDPEPTIQVSQVLGTMAFVYEKVRNALEYKDDHLIRRSAIERILKRRLGNHNQSREVAEALVRELIWARYLENDTIFRSTIDGIGRTVDKYLFLRQQVAANQAQKKSSYREWNNWLVSIASCEVDKQLALFDGTEALVKLMYKWLKQNFTWVDGSLSQEEKDIQLYVAIHRSLVKSDQAILRYHLLNLYFPGWHQANEPLWSRVADQIYPLKETIEKHLKSGVGIQLYRYVNHHTAPFLILESLVEENPSQARKKVTDPEELEKAVTEVCQRRYAGISQKLRRGVVRSIIYVFITKMVVAILLELPYDLLLVKNPKPGPLVANLVFPPFLMFVVGISIRAPGGDNTLRVISRLRNIIYGQRGPRTITFNLRAAKRDRFLSIVFAALYGFFFVVSFGGIIGLLNRFGFNLASGTLFILFLCVVTFFGFRIRRVARELSLRGSSEGLLTHLISVLSMPFLNIGAWLSAGFSQINIFTYLMDFLIEAPFKTIVELTEQWTSFLRQKKEELIETPSS